MDISTTQPGTEIITNLKQIQFQRYDTAQACLTEASNNIDIPEFAHILHLAKEHITLFHYFITTLDMVN